MRKLKQRAVPAPVALVRADGDVDRATIEACDYLLAKVGDDTPSAIVDLSRATHLDYRAVVLLLARRRTFLARGGELAVAAARADVRNVLRAAAGLDLPVFPSLAEATAYVRTDLTPWRAAS